MSQETVEQIIGKVMLDAGFRDALLANPERTLASFQLTEAEKTDLKRMDAETLDLLAGILTMRLKQLQMDSVFPIQRSQERNP